MSIPFWGLLLQTVFILSITIFSFIRSFVFDNYTVYILAFFDLFIGLASALCGLYGLISETRQLLSLIILLFGLLICFFFIVAYLLPEAGMPPAIPWLYPE